MRLALAATLVCALAACGGGGSGSGGTPPSMFTVGANVSGLAGGTMVLQNNGGDNLTVTTNAAVTFATALAGGAAYSVSVLTQPLGQACAPANAAGTIGSANITNVTVTCVATSNVTAIILDNGPPTSNTGALNAPFVSVTVCAPGTANCVVVDHVLLDTGSVGLRVGAWALGTPVLALPATLVATGGSPLLECYQFADGYIWGAVRNAEVRIANGTAANIPIHVIGDASAPIPAPPTCSTGTNGNLLTAESTLQMLGANGTLGADVFHYDCDVACATTALPGYYYTCPGNPCPSTTAGIAVQVQNPMFSFAAGLNNGIEVVLPNVIAKGQSDVPGVLVVGIDTPNSPLGSAQIIMVDASGEFTTVYHSPTAGDLTLPGSFVDSGSNGLFFNDSADSTLVQCTQGSLMNTGFYCPSGTLNLSATLMANAGFTGSATTLFTVQNLDTVLTANGSATAVPGVAGTNPVPAAGFDWGLPFFFGRSVFVAFEGQATSTIPGPYFAF